MPQEKVTFRQVTAALIGARASVSGGIFQGNTVFGHVEGDVYIVPDNMPQKVIESKEHESFRSVILASFRPPHFNHKYIIRERYQGELNRLFSETDIVCLSGLGGAGKTRLAEYYFYNSDKKYDKCYWLEASSLARLQEQFRKLALGLELISFENQFYYDWKFILNLIGNHLEKHSPWLLVYDNVEDDYIANYISFNKGDILITSRNSGILYEKIITTTMQEDEARKLLIQYIPTSNNHDPQLINLLKKLGYLPLALAQASAYMCHHGCSVSVYYEHYCRYKDKLLAYDGLRKYLNAEHEPVAITWWMNIKNLQEDAINILNVVSLIHSQNIPWDLLEKVLSTKNDPSLLFDKARKSLMSYSLMEFDPIQRIAHIHRLVKKIILQDLKQNEARKKSYIYQVAAILAEKLTYDDNRPETLEESDPYLPHAEQLLLHAKKANIFDENLILIQIKIASYQLFEYRTYDLAIEKLLLIEIKINEIFGEKAKTHKLLGKAATYLAYAYFFKGEYEVAKKYGKMGGRIFFLTPEVKCPKNAFDVLHILGNIHYKQAKYKNAEEYYQKAQDYSENCAKGIISHARGNVKYQQAYFDEAIEFYLDSFKIKIRAYKTITHVDIAITIYQLGNIALDFGDYSMAGILYKKALEIRKKIFISGEHIEIANSLSKLGKYNLAINKINKAKKCYLEALRIYNKVLTNCIHSDMGEILNGLSTIECYEGNLDEMKIHLKKAESIFTNIYHNRSHQDIINNKACWGDYYMKNNKYNKALKEYSLAFEECQNLYGSRPHVITMDILDKIINCLSYIEENETQEYRTLKAGIKNKLDAYKISSSKQKLNILLRELNAFIDKDNENTSPRKYFSSLTSQSDIFLPLQQGQYSKQERTSHMANKGKDEEKTSYSPWEEIVIKSRKTGFQFKFNVDALESKGLNTAIQVIANGPLGRHSKSKPTIETYDGSPEGDISRITFKNRDAAKFFLKELHKIMPSPAYMMDDSVIKFEKINKDIFRVIINYIKLGLSIEKGRLLQPLLLGKNGIESPDYLKGSVVYKKGLIIQLYFINEMTAQLLAQKIKSTIARMATLEIVSSQLPRKSFDLLDKAPIDINSIFVGRENEMNYLSRAVGKTGVVLHALIGNAGIGKTILAAQYVMCSTEMYSSVIWAPTLDLMTIYKHLIQSLGLVVKPQESVKNWVTRLYAELMTKNSKTLIIIDDAVSPQQLVDETTQSTIEDFLPDASLLDNGNSLLHIILTSRFEHWPSAVQVMTLPVFTAIEASVCLKQLLPSLSNTALQEKLAQTLGYSPLAIQMAAQYIEESGNNEEAVQNFMEAQIKVNIQQQQLKFLKWLKKRLKENPSEGNEDIKRLYEEEFKKLPGFLK